MTIRRRRRRRHRAHAADAGHAPARAAKDEMGHGASMDMAGLVRDMRNRFLVCLAFAIPLFIWAPMGLPLPTPAPPFGLTLDQWMFVLSTGAVLWPSWSFFVAAWRALRNGILNMAVLVVLSVGIGYIFSVAAIFLFEGETQVDESMLTSESMPVTKLVGSGIAGATINKSGAFRFRATKVGADTALAQIVKLVHKTY